MGLSDHYLAFLSDSSNISECRKWSVSFYPSSIGNTFWRQAAAYRGMDADGMFKAIVKNAQRSGLSTHQMYRCIERICIVVHVRGANPAMVFKNWSNEYAVTQVQSDKKLGVILSQAEGGPRPADITLSRMPICAPYISVWTTMEEAMPGITQIRQLPKLVHTLVAAGVMPTSGGHCSLRALFITSTSIPLYTDPNPRVSLLYRG